MPGNCGREIEDVPHRRRTERIDRLGVVPHDRQPLPLGRESAEDLGLQRVGVLVLVDKDRVEAGADRIGGLRRRQQGMPEEQQVVVIQHGLGLFAIDVAREEPLERVDVLAAPGEGVADDLGQGLPAVDAAAVDVEARSLQRKPRLGFGKIQLGADGVHQVFGIAPVEDREFLRQTDRSSVETQQPRGDGMERSAPNASGRGPQAAARCSPPHCRRGSGRRGGAFRPPPAG